MGEKITIWTAALAAVIIFPCMLTLMMNGRYGKAESRVSALSTGRDVLLQIDGANMLMDVEQYIAGVLPGLVAPDSEQDIIEAQAVAVRTKIYYEMGNNSVIQASQLEFTYYTKQDYIDKWGEAKYKRIKEIYETAVLNTVGKIIE
ncbi:MAG: SpoIID/LytB domain-containing protein [Wujia sp.]